MKYAACNGHIVFVRELITEYGAVPNKQDKVSSAVFVTSIYVCV